MNGELTVGPVLHGRGGLRESCQRDMSVPTRGVIVRLQIQIRGASHIQTRLIWNMTQW